MTTDPRTLNTDWSTPPAPPPSRGRWLVIAMAIGLVALPWLCTAIPAEIARWFGAAAAEAELESDLPRALVRIDQAIRWNPREPNLYAYRASLRLKRRDLDDALKDADRAVELAQGTSAYAFYQRILVHQRRGDHESALRDVNQLLELASDGLQPQYLPTGEVLAFDYDQLLNLRAYSYALADQQVELGLQDIAEAFRRRGTEEEAAYLDTRGYLYYLSGDLDSAEKDLQRAVELVEETIDDYRKRTDGQESKLSGRDALLWERQGRFLNENLAVMLHHRGLVHAARGRAEEAEEDLSRARELGYSPEDGVW